MQIRVHFMKKYEIKDEDVFKTLIHTFFLIVNQEKLNIQNKKSNDEINESKKTVPLNR